MIDIATDGAKYPLDIENNQEKLTPYMLAVLRENFDIAQILLNSGYCDMLYKNVDGETVFDIAKRLDIIPVQKFLIIQQKEYKQMMQNQQSPQKSPVASPQKDIVEE